MHYQHEDGCDKDEDGVDRVARLAERLDSRALDEAAAHLEHEGAHHGARDD